MSKQLSFLTLSAKTTPEVVSGFNGVRTSALNFSLCANQFHTNHFHFVSFSLTFWLGPIWSISWHQYAQKWSHDDLPNDQFGFACWLFQRNTRVLGIYGEFCRFFRVSSFTGDKNFKHFKPKLNRSMRTQNALSKKNYNVIPSSSLEWT